MEQNIRLDVNHMMADMLGGEYGVTQAQLAAMQDAAMKAQHAVEANRGTGWLGWMNLPYNQEEIVSEIEKVAEHVRKTFKYFAGHRRQCARPDRGASGAEPSALQ